MDTRFCERKLFPNQPEILNSISALYICYISYKDLLKLQNSRRIELHANPIIIMTHSCIFINGIAAFLYHWTESYLFKICDAYTMIIPMWLTISNIFIRINVPYTWIIIFSLINIIILLLIVYSWFDYYFPFVFGFEMLLIIPLYSKTIMHNRISNINTKLINNGSKGICICGLSAAIWIISEKYCNIYLILGHSIWHIGMSTGVSYILNYFYNIQ